MFSPTPPRLTRQTFFEKSKDQGLRVRDAILLQHRPLIRHVLRYSALVLLGREAARAPNNPAGQVTLALRHSLVTTRGPFQSPDGTLGTLRPCRTNNATVCRLSPRPFRLRPMASPLAASTRSARTMNRCTRDTGTRSEAQTAVWCARMYSIDFSGTTRRRWTRRCTCVTVSEDRVLQTL